IEDPVEFTHPNKNCIINQREIGQDTHSYQNALRSSLREAPDVILIGEIRDRETMEAALELAGTGHLAISTLHANNAHQTMDRIVNMFPEEMHKQLFMDLALNLRAIVSQRLVPTKDGRRCAAVEVMINTPHTAELILQGRIDEIRESMESSPEKGVQTFDMALHALYKAGRIDMEEELKNADPRPNPEGKLYFGQAPNLTAARASNTVRSTLTRFIAGPVSLRTPTPPPAQPPSSHAMYSASDSWHGNPYSRA